jgi:hypothetical protein
MHPMEQLTTRQAAEYLGISTPWLVHLASQHRFKPLAKRGPRGTKLWLGADVAAMKPLVKSKLTAPKQTEDGRPLYSSLSAATVLEISLGRFHYLRVALRLDPVVVHGASMYWTMDQLEKIDAHVRPPKTGVASVPPPVA